MAETAGIESNFTRLTGREARTQSIATRFTITEEQALLRCAEASGRNLREWAREVLLREANAATVDSGIELLLTEIVGLQLFLAHVLSPIACGKAITTDEYENLLSQVRASKHSVAHEAMAKHARPEKEE